MKAFKGILAALGLVLLGCSPVWAQSATLQYYTNGATHPAVTPVSPLPTTGLNAIQTYSAAIVGNSYSSAGDLVCINGSATKTIYVKKIRVSAVASAGVVIDTSIVKRSTADTGGTSTTLTDVPHDSNNAAGTATVKAYTVSATPGTSVGTIRAQKLAVATTTTPATAQTPVIFDFARYYDQTVILRGAAEGVCLVVAATAGGSWDVDMQWTEQ